MPNSSVILHKRSSVPGAVPSVVSLSSGELAVNTADGKLFVKLIDNTIKSFSDDSQKAFVLNSQLSGVVSQYGSNSITEVYAQALGGVNNLVSGAASSIINGEQGIVDSDFSLIGTGLGNKIDSTADFSIILGGHSNRASHENVFVLGTGLSSHSSNFTYVNNLSVQGVLHGDGSKLTGLTADAVNSVDTEVRLLTANWESVYTIVQENSSNNWDNSLANLYADVRFLPLTGGTVNGNLYLLSSLEIGSGSTALYVSNNKIGINTEEPNTELTVNGSISSNSLVYDANGHSSQWNSAYTTVQNSSATWENKTTLSTVIDYLSTNNVFLSSVKIGSQTTTATLFVTNQKVGINSEYPNHELTVIGNVSATGVFYGDGSNLTGITAGDVVATSLVRSNSGFWESVYNTVYANSASNWDNSLISSYIDNNFLPISGGTLTGNLSVLGDLVYVDTSVAVVSTMYIDTNSILDPALRITQRGSGDVIRVEDSENPDSTPFIINSDGLVGIGTSTPNKELTVIGNVSASGLFYGDGSNLTGIIAGDTEATTFVRSNSANWESTYTTIQSNSANWESTYTTIQSNSANWQTTFQASSAYVSSNPTGITGASALTKLLQITQAGYNSITPASDTLYIIVG